MSGDVDSPYINKFNEEGERDLVSKSSVTSVNIVLKSANGWFTKTFTYFLNQSFTGDSFCSKICLSNELPFNLKKLLSNPTIRDAIFIPECVPKICSLSRVNVNFELFISNSVSKASLFG